MYYVCLSVTGLRLKYMGSRIVYVPLWHVTFMMQLHTMEVENSEDRSRHQNESRDMEDN